MSSIRKLLMGAVAGLAMVAFSFSGAMVNSADAQSCITKTKLVIVNGQISQVQETTGDCDSTSTSIKIKTTQSSNTTITTTKLIIINGVIQ